MAGPKKVTAAGLKYVHFGKLAANTFYPAGLDGTLANGENAGLVRLQGAKSLSLTVPEATRVVQTGDDEPQSTFIFAPTEDATGTLNLGISDLDYEAMAQGLTVYTVDDLQIAAFNPADPSFVDHLILLSRQAKSKDAATSGLSRWVNYLFPIANGVPRDAQGITEREASDFLVDLIVNKAAQFPWGLALGAANVGTTSAGYFRINTLFPLMIDVFIGDNSTDTFTLSKIPYGDHSSDYLASYNYATGANADSELTSVSTSTGLVTYTSAIAAAAVRVFVYEWDPAAN